jgi:NADPH-dependent glutamate synthase beta subunit-like oxidoreductase/CO/xanthine dehydrogenase FAD-binding subunit
MKPLLPFEYPRVQSVEEAISKLLENKGKARPIAGGTDLLSVLKDAILPTYPAVLVSLKNIQDLDYIKEKSGVLRIGAMVKLNDIADSSLIRGKYSALAEAAATVATPQIRNMGTIGGNLCQDVRCWYYRYPHYLGERVLCFRKGGHDDRKCHALFGENRYHSIFGAAQINLPPCSSGCPSNTDVPLYLSKIREGEIPEAAKILLDSNPIPAITGRVCPHYCEASCNRKELDESVFVNGIERFMGDWILENWDDIIKPSTTNPGRSVAIVGSGPGGLSAAFYLCKMGYQVTVFDKMPEAGGMLAYGIPAYRLPKTLIRRQVACLQSMGIKFEMNIHVGSDVSLESLRKKFDSVFLATGAWNQRALRIEKEELLISGIDFLTEVNLGLEKAPGKRVLVIGGGNVAVDAAITARRLGSERVTMACLESREEMPAFPENVQGAIDEGVIVMPSWGPHRVLETAGRVSGMELIRCTSVFDEEGHFHPNLDPGIREQVEADQIISAIGQVPDLSYAVPSLRTERGLVVVGEDTQATSIPSVYAGGDLVAGKHMSGGGDQNVGTASVIGAIASGRRAAASINSYLTGEGPTDQGRSSRSRFSLTCKAGSLKKMPRAKVSGLPPASRTIDVEDTPGLSSALVNREASRCLNCGCVAINASDLAPALIALAAKIKTTKRTLDAEDFFKAGPVGSTVLDEDELVTEIQVPGRIPWTRQAFVKFRIRDSIDFSIVSVASAVRLNRGKVIEARIALGAVAPLPIRAREVEDFLKGKALTDEIAEAAGAIAVKHAKPLSKNKYKIQIVRALVKRAILDQMSPRDAQQDEVDQKGVSPMPPFSRDAETAGPVKDAKTAGPVAATNALTWTSEAEAQLDTVPFFVREMARSGIEKYASEHGIAVITPEVLLEARKVAGI